MGYHSGSAYSSKVFKDVLDHYKCWPKDILAYRSKDDLKFCSNVIENITDRVDGSKCFEEEYTYTQHKGLSSMATPDTHVIMVYPSELNESHYFVPSLIFMDVMEPILNMVCLLLGFIAVYLMISVRIQTVLTKNNA